MTASEQRLHPASILFDAARYARIFAWPALLAFLGGGRGADPWSARFDYGVSETWLWILMAPSLVLSVARYLSFRVRYEPDALVIRSGILFRNVRHVPYARIQNLDAIQNVFHRALGVVEIRLETGGSADAEARLSVLPRAALDDMRARVFAGRSGPTDTPATSPQAAGLVPTGTTESLAPAAAIGHVPAPPGPAETLLRLSVRDLLLCGFLENKGMVLVGAAYGALWEAGALNQVWGWFFDGDVDARGLFREVVLAVSGGAPLPVGRLLMAVGGVAAFLVLVRLISMAWAFVRLYDFQLARHDDDLRISFGLFTKVAATIPRRRVQTLTIEQGWLHRWLGRASVRVETAGGPGGATGRDREWVAPLIRLEHLPAVVAGVVPGVRVDEAAWQPVHPRAFRRALKPALAITGGVTILAMAALGWRAGGWIGGLALAWSTLNARQYVRYLGWTATDDAVGFRSGWLTRRETYVRTNRVQVVIRRQSPFDRRAGMARLRVDTAGAGELSHRVDIPYLAAATADALRHRLVGLAARTAFRV